MGDTLRAVVWSNKADSCVLRIDSKLDLHNFGWTVSDGSPINTEYTPANQIIALKSGTTKKVGVTVAFVGGTNGAIVVLDKDCKNLPCGTIDKTHIC